MNCALDTMIGAGEFQDHCPHSASSESPKSQQTQDKREKNRFGSYLEIKGSPPASGEVLSALLRVTISPAI